MVWCLCVVIPSETPHPVKMLSSAMTRSLDFLVALFTDFTPIFGGPPGADGSVSPTDRRASRTQENWLLSRLQATFSPSASPNRRRCNSDASACHILCLPPPSKVHRLPQGLIAHGASSPSFYRSSSSASQQTKSPGGTSQDRGAGSSATNSVDQNLNYGQGGGGKERSISMVDMYIDNSEPVENVGQIHFSLEYDFQNTTLILKIIQVRLQSPVQVPVHVNTSQRSNISVECMPTIPNRFSFPVVIRNIKQDFGREHVYRKLFNVTMC